MHEFIRICLERGVPASTLREFLLFLDVDARMIEGDLPRPRSWHASSVNPDSAKAYEPVPPPPSATPMAEALVSVLAETAKSARAFAPPPSAEAKKPPATPPPAPPQAKLPPPELEESPTREVSLCLETQTRIASPVAAGEKTAELLGLNVPVRLAHSDSLRKTAKNRRTSGAGSGATRDPEPPAPPSPPASRGDKMEVFAPKRRARDWLLSMLSANGMLVGDARAQAEAPAVKPAIRRPRKA